MQAKIGRKKLLQKSGIQPQQPFAGVKVLKLEAKAKITLIGSH